MAASGFTKDGFALFDVVDALRDFMQNWADQALGHQAKLPISQWQRSLIRHPSNTEGVPGRVCLDPDQIDIFNHGVINFDSGKSSVDLAFINTDTRVDLDQYIHYGLSSKRTSANAVGYMGIGVITATGCLLSRGFKVAVRAGDVKLTPEFSTGANASAPTLKWYRKTLTRDNHEFTVRIEGISVHHLRKAINSVLWLSPPSADDIVYEDSAIGQLFRRTSKYAGQIYICHNYVTDYHHDDGTPQFGINLFEARSGSWLTQDRQGIRSESWEKVDKRVARLWNAATTDSARPDVAKTAVTLLWEALNEGGVWESDLLEEMRPACMALAERFRAMNGDNERVFPRREDFGNALYKALTLVMGTEEDYLRRRLMSADDSDALQAPGHAVLRRILEKALPKMDLTIDDLRFKTTEDPDPHSTYLVRNLIYMDDSILDHQDHDDCIGSACVAVEVLSEIHGKVGKTALADLLRLIYQEGVEARNNTNVNGNNRTDRSEAVERQAEGEDSDGTSSSPIVIEPRTGREGGQRVNEVHLLYVRNGKLVHDVKDGRILNDIGRKRSRLD